MASYAPTEIARNTGTDASQRGDSGHQLLQLPSLALDSRIKTNQCHPLIRVSRRPESNAHFSIRSTSCDGGCWVRENLLRD